MSTATVPAGTPAAALSPALTSAPGGVRISRLLLVVFVVVVVSMASVVAALSLSHGRTSAAQATVTALRSAQLAAAEATVLAVDSYAQLLGGSGALANGPDPMAQLTQADLGDTSRDALGPAAASVSAIANAARSSTPRTKGPAATAAGDTAAALALRDNAVTRLAALSVALAVEVSEAEQELARLDGIQYGISVIGVVLSGLACLAAAGWVKNHLTQRLERTHEIARRMASGSAERIGDHTPDIIGAIARRFDESADHRDHMMSRMVAAAQRSELSRQLADALDMADDESEVAAMVERALGQVCPPGSSAQLLAADDSGVLGSLVEVIGDVATCSVTDATHCVAMRRSSLQTYPDPDAINACLRLQGRGAGGCSAVCVPVTFMGRPLGVLHVVDQPRGSTGDTDPAKASDIARVEHAGVLVEAAASIGSRLGTLRSFAHEKARAATDGLTGLPNRRAFEQLVPGMLAAGGALVMADLDHFKLVNDSYGHDAGDRALRSFTDVVGSTIRDEDVFCRWGGEEFTLFLPGADAGDVTRILARIKARLAEHTATNPPGVTASYGVAFADGSSLHTLIAAADRALYRAKESGRDRWTLADTAALATMTKMGESTELPVSDPA